MIKQNCNRHNIYLCMIILILMCFVISQACSFILATPDTLKYSTLYDTLVNLLGVGCQNDPSLRFTSDPQLSYLGLCAVQYAFSLSYRLLLTMPPSVSALEAMASADAKLEGSHLLHALLWGPRASHKIFNGWIKVLFFFVFFLL